MMGVVKIQRERGKTNEKAENYKVKPSVKTLADMQEHHTERSN